MQLLLYCSHFMTVIFCNVRLNPRMLASHQESYLGSRIPHYILTYQKGHFIKSCPFSNIGVMVIFYLSKWGGEEGNASSKTLLFCHFLGGICDDCGQQ